jgi:hypothetical protein
MTSRADEPDSGVVVIEVLAAAGVVVAVFVIVDVLIVIVVDVFVVVDVLIVIVVDVFVVVVVKTCDSFTAGVLLLQLRRHRLVVGFAFPSEDLGSIL